MSWSLKYKFIVTLAAFTVVLSVSFGLIAIQRLNSDLEDQILKQGEYIANDLKAKSFGANSESFLAQIAQGYWILWAGGGNVFYVQVVKYGQPYTGVLGRTERIKELKLLDEVLTPPVSESRSHRVTSEGVPYLDLIKPVGETEAIDINTGELKQLPNYVRIGLSLAAVQEQVRREFLIISGLSALYIVVGLLIAFWLYQSILGPIDVLTQSVKRFKRDRQARAHVTSRDELRTLAEEFNRMADSIQERDERLERVNRELRKANQVKSEFLAVMGHELKTPIHAIRGYSQLLLEGIDGSLTVAQQEDLENIVKSGDHLRALIDNILQFSKLEAGGETLHPTEVEVGRLLEEALQNVKVLAREKGIELHAHANGLRIQADETKLKQVLINLLSNALKYTPRGQVDVTVERRNGEVLFAVKDTGIGIPEEYHEKIFEPFTQLDSSTTRPWGGLGLGLSIVKKYVEMHGGRIWLTSRVGAGTTFYFTIPEQSCQGGENA